MTSTILIGQWPNLLTFRAGDHASATPLESDKMATRTLRGVKAAASKCNNDLRVVREEAAANNDVAVELEDESDDE